ncbi:MAG: endo alpha-1,4 polygalactosaminidase [Limisphaerales bacterium]
MFVGLVLLALFLAGSSPAARFCVNYSATPDLEELKRFDELILSPYARVDVHSLVRSAQRPYAYLSVVEIASDARYRNEVAQLGIKTLGQNTTWGSSIADLRDSRWTDFVVNKLAARSASMGFRGFFLDTIDSVAIAEKNNPNYAKEYRAALVNLIKTLRKRFPKHTIIMNRGFPLLSELNGVIDGVLVESLFQKYDFNSKQYTAESKSGTEWLLNILQPVKKAGMEVYVVDYVDPSNRTLALQTAARIGQLGFHPFISTVALDGQYLNLASANAPVPSGAQIVPRRVFTVFGNNDANLEFRVNFPLDSGVARFLQMPLEYYGYEVDFHHLWLEEVPDTLSDEHGVVVLDRELVVPPDKESKLADWLIQQKNQGRKVLFFGKIPFEREDVRARILKAFEFMGSGNSVEGVHVVQFKHQSPETGFETPNQLTPADFHDLQAPTYSRIWLTLEAQNLKRETFRFDPIFVTKWGGALFDPHTTFMRPDEDEMWKVDPFAFLNAFLGMRNFPAPDATTRDGVRMFYAHIDGDGFRHKSAIELGRHSGDLLNERVVDRYPFPITLSIIEAEIRGIIFNSEPGIETLMSQQARDVFASEKVEAGSHSYSHPYFWVNPDKTQDIYDRRNLKLSEKIGYGEKVNYHREVVGSIQYIEKELLPPGKRVEIMLWSGNCRPGVKALEWCRKLGVENMNGGDTAITRKNPSYTRVFPHTAPWDNEVHVFCSQQNENVYRFRWKGGADPNSVFYSGFILALDSFKKTELPRRLKPVSIYYHWYSGDNLPSMNALKQLYEWCLTQELHSVTAAPFARMVRDALKTKVYHLGPNRFLLRNDGFLGTFRLPWTGSVPDMAACIGVKGWRQHGDQMYIHTSGERDTVLTLSAQPRQHFYLESSTAEIRFTNLEANLAEMQMKDFRPCQVVIAGARPNQPVNVVIDGKTHPYQADAQGRLKMQFPSECRVKILPR